MIMGMGKNRTGIMTSPIDAPSIIKAAAEAVPNAPGDGAGFAAMRGDYVRNAEPLGSVPPPASVRGVAQASGDMISGVKPVVLIDKLAERLAFERTGTRMYEAFLAKLRTADDVPSIISIGDVERFHDEERAHMTLVKHAIEHLGADPTAQTPWADVDGVAAMGLIQVIADPRTSVAHSLHALQIAELADGDGWAMLFDLASNMGHREIAEGFARAIDEEAVHLATVRRWMTELVRADAGL